MPRRAHRGARGAEKKKECVAQGGIENDAGSPARRGNNVILLARTLCIAGRRARDGGCDGGASTSDFYPPRVIPSKPAGRSDAFLRGEECNCDIKHCAFQFDDGPRTGPARLLGEVERATRAAPPLSGNDFNAKVHGV